MKVPSVEPVKLSMGVDCSYQTNSSRRLPGSQSCLLIQTPWRSKLLELIPIVDFLIYFISNILVTFFQEALKLLEASVLV